jgi:hypothetical protein
MQAAAHNPAFAKKAGVPRKVAREFAMADIGRKIAVERATKAPGK